MQQSKSTWPVIPKQKKVIRCKSCGKKIEIENFKQKLCKKCGYRETRKRSDKKCNA